MNIRQAIEVFHLLFSHRLSNKIDRNLFALKGGCNLRFYFRSIRYSEDIDFDVQKISVETLKKNVDKLLGDASFIGVLKRSHGLEIVDWSAPKQTEATQRWKVSLRLSGQSLIIPTKIEFSRRSPIIEGALIEPVNSELINEYKLQPIFLQHFPLKLAIEQKISALLHRTETQARDIIYLHILTEQLNATPLPWSFSQEDKEKALTTLMSISFQDYKSQVWPYIMASYQDYYSEESTWNSIQETVVGFIEQNAIRGGL